MRRLMTLLITLAAVVLLTGCFRGMPKKKPPIHLIPDMDTQPKYLPQSEGHFFADDMSMRQPVYGTVARGDLEANDSLYKGVDVNGQPLEHNPLPVTMDLLKQGQKEFNIYCTPCHSKVGDGRGIIVQYNYVPPASFHTDRLRNAPDGHFFDVMTHGLRNMPSYANQVAVRDRWAIVAYIRALQRSQHAPLADIPQDKRNQLK